MSWTPEAVETRFKFWRELYPVLREAIRTFERGTDLERVIEAIRSIEGDVELGRMKREQFYDKHFYDVMTELAEEWGRKTKSPSFERRLKVIRDIAGLVFTHDQYYLWVFRELVKRYTPEEGER